MTPGVLRMLLPLLLGLGLALPARAQTPGEYQIKAAYLLNFARYTEWPAPRLPAGAALRLCLLGRDPFAGGLAGMEGRLIQGHDVRVRQLDGVEQADDCHVVFISDSEERRIGPILRALAFHATLTVSDIDGFAEMGGDIGLVTEDQRVRFDINQAALTRDNLHASSQLLHLGRNVFGRKGP